MNNFQSYIRKCSLWIFVDGRHKKTIPVKFAPALAECIGKLDFTKKRLSNDEIILLTSKLLEKPFELWLNDLAKKEKHLYLLIKDATPIAVRQVYSKIGGNRKELILDNNLKVKIPNSIFRHFQPRTEAVYLNF